MTRPRFEGWLAGGAVLGLTVAAFGPSAFENARRRLAATRTLTLTAAAPGVWTAEPVSAANAWRRDFAAARPVLRRGEPVKLRLRSTDVVHSFALPDLGLDPVEVPPGRVVTVTLTPERAGAFPYYCTVVCGERHFAMRGFVVVADGTEAPSPGPPLPGQDYWRTPLPTPAGSFAERGAALFRRAGCVTCHGEGGRGGVRNPNSMNAEVPELASLARRTFLFASTDVEAFRGLLSGPQPLEEIEAAPDVPLFPAVKGQYLATRQLVAEGRRSTKLDAQGPQPALDMPAWGSRLNVDDIDAILTYLLDPSAVPGHGAVGQSKGETR